MYASRSDMITRFGERQINELESMHEDGDIATQNALADAEEMMNSYLSCRYYTPLKKTEHLKIICCNIARFFLYFNQATEEVERRYEEAIKWLKDVANGKANVTFAEPLTASEIEEVTKKPVVPIGDAYHGSVFGDDVFKSMPNLESFHVNKR